MSSLDNAKALMGYVRASARPGCKDCAHAEERDCIHPTWWCKQGGFLVGPLAICDRHQARRVPDAGAEAGAP
jgi:hypothetical protein